MLKAENTCVVPRKRVIYVSEYILFKCYMIFYFKLIDIEMGAFRSLSYMNISEYIE